MKYRILIACLLIAGLLLFGCPQKTAPVVQEPAANESGQATNATPTVTAAPCSTGNIVQKDECFYSLAKQKASPDICKNIYSIDKLDECYNLFATANLEICRKITNADMKYECLLQNALREKSESICSLIENEGKRAGCLAQVLPPCMTIPEGEGKELCLALDAGDLNLCKSDACFVEYASNKSDRNACLHITALLSRQICLATIDKNVAVCKNATLLPIQDACIEQVSKMLGDVDGCDLATDASTYKNNCYTYFAIKNMDMSICAKTSPEERRDECYANYSIASANVDACMKVMESLGKTGCYYHAATVNRMPSLCNPLTLGSQRTTCYGMAIMNDRGPVPSDCPLVAETAWKDQCYYNAARSTYNGTLCDGISPGTSHDNCKALFD